MTCECGHPKSHHYFDPDVRTGPWKCLTFFDPKCSCGVYREVPEKKEVAMTDAELDAMLATHAQSEASAIEDDARVAATYRARSYVPALVAEVRRLTLALAASEEMFKAFKDLDESAPCAVHNLRYEEHCPDEKDNPDKVACRWGIAPSGVPESLRAENERLSLALALQQELADGYKAGLYGDPEPRGMSDAGIVAYHATLSLRRTCERQQKELADAAKDKAWLEDEARRLESALREGR